MIKEKVVLKTNSGWTRTGYYDEHNQFILHSFDDEPAIIDGKYEKFWISDGKLHRDDNLPAYHHYTDGDKWYDHGIEYWVIEGKRYNLVDEIYEKYKNQLIKSKKNLGKKLTKMNVDFISIGYDMFFIYLILNDTQRNEVILNFD